MSVQGEGNPPNQNRIAPKDRREHSDEGGKKWELGRGKHAELAFAGPFGVRCLDQGVRPPDLVTEFLSEYVALPGTKVTTGNRSVVETNVDWNIVVC